MKIKALVFLFFASIFFFGIHTVDASVVLSKPSNNLGLIGWWTFDAGTSTLAGDSSGNNETGTLTNGPLWTTGKRSRAIIFDGANDFVSVASTLATSTTYTVAGWYLFNTGAWTGSPLAFSTATGDVNGLFYHNGANGCSGTPLNTFGFFTWNCDTFGITGAAAKLADGKWHHIVAEFHNNAFATNKMWIDGVAQSLSQVAGSGINKTLVTTFRIGYPIPAPGADDVYTGKIDDIRVFNRALSNSEVVALYNSGAISVGNSSNSNALTDGLTARWTFDGRDTIWSSNTTADTVAGKRGVISGIGATGVTTGKIGQAFSFNGASSHVDVSNFTLPATGTFSAWVYSNFDENTCCSGTFPLLFDTDANRTAVLYNGTTKTYDLYTNAVNTNRAKYTIGADIVGWWHMTVTWGASGSQFYKDGVAVGTAGTGDNTGAAGSTFYIGTRNDLQRWWDGKIDDVRIYDHILTAAEIKKLANSGYSTASKSDADVLPGALAGFWSFDGKQMNWGTNQALDSSGAGNTGRLINMSTTTSPTIGRIGQALKFNGANNSYITIPFNAAFANAYPVTVTAFIKLNSINGCFSVIQAGNNADQTGWGWEMCGGPVTVEWTNNSGGAQTAYNGFAADKWYFVAISNASANSRTFYVYDVATNAIVAQENDSSNVPITLTNSATKIGTFDTGGGPVDYFNGTIDSLRVYKKALSASEIQKLYNLGR